MSEPPVGWTRGTGLEVFTLVRGVTYSKTDARSEPGAGLIPILRANNIQGGRIILDDFVYVPVKYVSQEQFLKPGDLLIATSSGSRDVVGKTALAGPEHSQFAFGAFCSVARPKTEAVPEWIAYFTRSGEYRKYVEEVALGTNINNFRTRDLEALPLPLVPRSEQRRIVAKLDALFKRSNSASDELIRVPRLVERYRQAILGAAFSGQMTAKWRASNPISPVEMPLVRESIRELSTEMKIKPWKKRVFDKYPTLELPNNWRQARLVDVALHRSGIAFKSGRFVKSGVQVVRLGNLYQGKLDLKRDPVFISDAKPEEAFFSARPLDILISQTGTRYKRDYGHFILMPEGQRAVFVNQRVLCLSVTKSVLPQFVAYYGATSGFRDFFFSQETGGVNQGNVGVSGVMDAPFPLPPLAEQREIVQSIRNAFARLDDVMSRATRAKILLDRLNKATLAKAFRGELVSSESIGFTSWKDLRRTAK